MHCAHSKLVHTVWIHMHRTQSLYTHYPRCIEPQEVHTGPASTSSPSLCQCLQLRDECMKCQYLSGHIKKGKKHNMRENCRKSSQVHVRSKRGMHKNALICACMGKTKTNLSFSSNFCGLNPDKALAHQASSFSGHMILKQGDDQPM